MGRRSKLPVCGNGIVEIGEVCDCGLNKSCLSVQPCCNPLTCQFYPGAECLSGPCCSGCKLLPSGYTCRASRNECDVPEFCNGTSPQCPEDNSVMDGLLCKENIGTCFQGVCAGADKQCVDLWGSGAKVAHESCYTDFNPSGSMSGHCGYDSRLHKYIPCFDDNIKCGLLHCEGGMPYPRIASSNFMIFNVNTLEGSHECKSISSPIHSILVNDGSICGESSFCQNNACIKQKSKRSCNPQKTCSGNGVCTSLGLCYCHPSWKGTDCSMYDNKYHDAYVFNRTLPYGSYSVSPAAFFGIATITFLLLILCIIISCLFRNKKPIHRRKSHIIKHSKQLHQPQVIINPTDIELDHRRKAQSQYDSTNSNLVSSPISVRQTPLKHSPFMASNRSITSTCTGLSYLPTDTPHSVRHINRKSSTNAIFSDSETPRTRIRRQTRHIGSPYLTQNSNHQNHYHQNQQQSYATLTLKRHADISIPYESSRRIYDDIDKLSVNENLRDFIQVLDSLAQEKFGSTTMNPMAYEKSLMVPSSPTETNESITLDSGYQSTKQLINTDEYATVVKPKQTIEKLHQRSL